MTPPAHPFVVAFCILLSFGMNVTGFLMLQDYGDGRLLFIGIVFAFLIWLGVIIGRGARTASDYLDDDYNEPALK